MRIIESELAFMELMTPMLDSDTPRPAEVSFSPTVIPRDLSVTSSA